MSERITDKELKELLQKINKEDLLAIFGISQPGLIVKFGMTQEELDDIAEMLYTYMAYIVPVDVGDIVKLDSKEYIVTCVYTDNSVDLLRTDEQNKKINMGIYRNRVEVISKLEYLEV